MKFLLLVSVLVFSLYSKALVYKITKENNSLYLGGTIHVLSTSDYPLAKEYFSAFENSDVLYLETDLGATQTPEFSQKIIQTLTYPEGKTLRDDLNISTYMALKKYCYKHGLPMESIERFKVGMSVMNILMKSLSDLNINAMGVDKYFYIQAKEVDKEIKFLESVESQIEILGSMGEGEENELVMSSLKDAGNLKEEMYNIIRHWRSANIQALNDDMINEFKSEYPELYADVLIKRNQAWIKKIEPMFESKEIEYILVGAMHLIGEDGLLAYFEKKGYKIEVMDVQ